jgi:hypothetical protein
MKRHDQAKTTDEKHNRHNVSRATGRHPSDTAGAQADDLPPNENIQKDADEVYGDTEIRDHDARSKSRLRRSS